MCHAAHMGEMSNAYKILVGKPEGTRPLRRTMCRWEDNIRMDLRGGKLWTGFIWLRTETSGGHGNELLSPMRWEIS